jgi:hypothetical protein
VTISSLTGNTAEVYILRCKFVNGYNGAAYYYARLNNDTGDNFGIQTLSGTNNVTAAVRGTNGASTGLLLSRAAALAEVCYSNTEIYAKSGYVRTALGKEARAISTTTVTDLYIYGQSWNNTADEITSIVIVSNQTDGLGIGTVIDLYKLVRKT